MIDLRQVRATDTGYRLGSDVRMVEVAGESIVVFLLRLHFFLPFRRESVVIFAQRLIE